MKIERVKSFSMHMFRKIIIILPYFYKIEVSTYKKLKIKKRKGIDLQIWNFLLKWRNAWLGRYAFIFSIIFPKAATYFS